MLFFSYVSHNLYYFYIKNSLAIRTVINSNCQRIYSKILIPIFFYSLIHHNHNNFCRRFNFGVEQSTFIIRRGNLIYTNLLFQFSLKTSFFRIHRPLHLYL